MNNIVSGMDLNAWIPDYYLLSPPRKCKNGYTIFHMRSNSNKRLFVNSLYESLLYYMNVIGYDVSRDEEGNDIIEEFRYYYPNQYKKMKEGKYKTKFFKRLEVLNVPIGSHGINGTAKIVIARFFDNDPSKDFGFSIYASSKTCILKLDPTIYEEEGKMFDPCKFIKDFLIKVSYPQQMYNYQLQNGYIRRLYYMYKFLSSQTGDYEAYNLPN